MAWRRGQASCEFRPVTQSSAFLGKSSNEGFPAQEAVLYLLGSISAITQMGAEIAPDVISLTSPTDICETPKVVFQHFLLRMQCVELSVWKPPSKSAEELGDNEGACCLAGSTTQGRIDQVAIFSLCHLHAKRQSEISAKALGDKG